MTVFKYQNVTEHKTPQATVYETKSTDMYIAAQKVGRAIW